jgi:hypothetical protein
MTVGTMSSSDTIPFRTWPGRDPAWPSQYQRRPEATLPAQALLTPERRGAAVGPGELLGTVVGGEHDDGVVSDAQLVELAEQLTDHPVQLLHAVGVHAQSRLVPPPIRQMGPHVHARRVVPQQERRLRLVGALDDVERPGQQVVLDGLHALARQGTRIDDALLANSPEPLVLGRVVHIGGSAIEHPTREEVPLDHRVVLGVVGLLRLLLGVQVVQVSVELVETVHGRKELVTVAQVVLADLGSQVALRPASPPSSYRCASEAAQ